MGFIKLKIQKIGIIRSKIWMEAFFDNCFSSQDN